MILIQIVLIIGFVGALLWFILNPTSRRTKAGVKLLMLAFTLVAIITIMFPDISNDIAHLLGVGYGVSLLTYLLTLAFIFLVIQLYIKSWHDQTRLTTLARKIALLEAALRDSKRHR